MKTGKQEGFDPVRCEYCGVLVLGWRVEMHKALRCPYAPAEIKAMRPPRGRSQGARKRAVKALNKDRALNPVADSSVTGAICPRCSGDGGVNGGCRLCDGSGWVNEESYQDHFAYRVSNKVDFNSGNTRVSNFQHPAPCVETNYREYDGRFGTIPMHDDYSDTGGYNWDGD